MSGSMAKYVVVSIFIIFLQSGCGSETNPAAPNPGFSANPYGFLSDFPVLIDQGGSGSGQPIYGFGGDTTKDKAGNRAALGTKRPVILIHGNSGDADTSWKPYFKVWLKNNGYSDSHIWALSYQGRVGTGETVNEARNNINDVRTFIDNVMSYLVVTKVDIIGHSLGGQLARGYLLGFKSDGSFDRSLRRLNNAGSIILISVSNYGMGKNHPNPDKDSDGSLFNITETNNFSRVDGVTNLIPNSSSIKYICIYPKYDYEQDIYVYYGSGHPLSPVNTARLGSAAYYELDTGYGLGYPENSDPANPVPYKNITNHSKLIADPALFNDYVLPNLNY